MGTSVLTETSRLIDGRRLDRLPAQLPPDSATDKRFATRPIQTSATTDEGSGTS